MFVTMTTVGYGDVTPTSTIGQILTVCAMIIGLLFLAMPISIVGNNFTETWGVKEEVIFSEVLRELMDGRKVTLEHVKMIYDDMDVEGYGQIDFIQFYKALKNLRIKFDDDTEKDMISIHKLFNEIDEDASGTLSIQEFCKMLVPDYDETYVADFAAIRYQREKQHESIDTSRTSVQEDSTGHSK